jgi:hypothetical protein
VLHLIQTHLPSHAFVPIITRDTPDLLPKPDPAGILHIAQGWGLSNRAESLIMVGISLSIISFNPHARIYIADFLT